MLDGSPRPRDRSPLRPRNVATNSPAQSSEPLALLFRGAHPLEAGGTR